MILRPFAPSPSRRVGPTAGVPQARSISLLRRANGPVPDGPAPEELEELLKNDVELQKKLQGVEEAARRVNELMV